MQSKIRRLCQKRQCARNDTRQLVLRQTTAYCANRVGHLYRLHKKRRDEKHRLISQQFSHGHVSDIGNGYKAHEAYLQRIHICQSAKYRWNRARQFVLQQNSVQVSRKQATIIEQKPIPTALMHHLHKYYTQNKVQMLRLTLTQHW